MSLIQLIMVCGSAVLCLAYLKFFRSVTRDRLFALLLFIASVAATLFPDTTTTIANWLGVGRGVDLVFYLFSLATAFALILLYSKIGRLERIQTELVRELAIRGAEKPHSF